MDEQSLLVLYRMASYSSRVESGIGGDIGKSNTWSEIAEELEKEIAVLKTTEASKAARTREFVIELDKAFR